MMIISRYGLTLDLDVRMQYWDRCNLRYLFENRCLITLEQGETPIANC